MGRVCKSFSYFIRADIALYRKFIRKELWWQCATYPERKQYMNSKKALKKRIKLEFVFATSCPTKVCLKLHPKMSLATLHLILCAFGLYPPYRTALHLQHYDCTNGILVEAQTSPRVFSKYLMDVSLFNDTKCIRVEPISLILMS